MKQTFITEQKVFEELKKAIVETLRSDEAAIKPESSLIKDLGAESLDFLDINYRLEQTFGIKMARHFILEHIEEMFGEGSAIDEDGKLTEKAITLLKLRYGDVYGDLSGGMDMDTVPTLITAGSMTQGVLDLLDTLPNACSKCGSAAWKTDDGIRIKCGSCNEFATFTNGDELIKNWLTAIQQEKKIF
jgi:acyl carrier protein